MSTIPTDIIAVLETPELKLSATARTIAYRFNGKVDVKETLATSLAVLVMISDSFQR